MLFLGVWWAWNLSAWATNWIDPDTQPVRLLILLLMLFSLVMSAAIPEAFHGRAWSFALAYVLLQLLRSAFGILAFRGQQLGTNFVHLLAWSAISGVAWLAGAAAHGDWRLLIWVVAVLLDYTAPWIDFALPGAPGIPTGSLPLAGGHLAERNQLVLIIALGESMLAVGATYADLEPTRAVTAAFVAGFVTTVSLFWVYFVRLAEAGANLIAHASDPIAMGRTGFAYGHGIMVAGIIVVAVGIDRSVAHPSGHTAWATVLAIVGGPALFLAGNALFKKAISGRWPPSRLIAIAALAAVLAVAAHLSPLALSWAVAVVLLPLAIAAGRPHGQAARSVDSDRATVDPHAGAATDARPG